MKTNDDQLRSLLDEMMPDGEVLGAPQCAEVLGMVREERVRRTRQRAIASLAVIALGVFTFASFRVIPLETVPTRAARLVKPAAPAVQRINDAELLALLQDAGAPSALMEWPDGQRTLLVVEHSVRAKVQ